MASRARTPEAGCCARNPSGADRLPDRASPYFWRRPLDRKLVDVCACSTPKANLSPCISWTAVMQDSLVYLKTGSGLLYTSAMKRATLLGSYTSNSSSTRRTRLCLSLWLCLRLWVSGNRGRLFLLMASTSFAEIPMG